MLVNLEENFTSYLTYTMICSFQYKCTAITFSLFKSFTQINFLSKTCYAYPISNFNPYFWISHSCFLLIFIAVGTIKYILLSFLIYFLSHSLPASLSTLHTLFYEGSDCYLFFLFFYCVSLLLAHSGDSVNIC